MTAITIDHVAMIRAAELLMITIEINETT